MLVGVTGPICAGKGELVRILRDEYNFFSLGFGDEVRLEASRRNVELTRDNLQTLGNDLTIQFGESYWAMRLIGKIRKDGNYVVEGFRYPGQVEEFRKFIGFSLVGITAPFELRFDRYKLRGSDGDVLTAEAFGIMDRRDRGEGGLDGQKGDDTYRLIDYEIVNESTLEDLKREVSDLMITRRD